MKKFLTVFAVIGLAFSASVAGAAEPAAFDDGFGGSYFTAATPDALQDNGGDVNMMLSGADDALSDSLAEELGNIAPAAGGDDLFILPPEEEVSVNPGSEELMAPAVAPVPGMDPVQ
jgi:hypothetical protein